MRISWLSAEQIAAARQGLTTGGKIWDDHFAPDFVVPAIPDGVVGDDWALITEHVARAERVSEVVRSGGLDAANTRFASTGIAIEAATLAAAAYEGDVLELDQIIGVLGCAIDRFVFYAPFLELMAARGRTEVERTVRAYEDFVAAYSRALLDVRGGLERIGAVRDGLADYYVSAGRIEVALSASRAFLAAGSVSHAVRWLGVGAQRATALGREELALRLRQKQERVRERLS